MLGACVPICSSEGKAFLRLSGMVSYADYSAAWLAAFKEHQIEYEAHAQRLIGQAESTRGLSHIWLAMRGFDVKLMAVGGPMR